METLISKSDQKVQHSVIVLLLNGFIVSNITIRSFQNLSLGTASFSHITEVKLNVDLKSEFSCMMTSLECRFTVSSIVGFYSDRPDFNTRLLIFVQ